MTNTNTDENIKTYQEPKILKFNAALGKFFYFPSAWLSMFTNI
jgi:hypothetical protein